MGADIVFHNLDKIKFLISDATGLDVAYAYEDLVFAEHGLFIVQFDRSNTDKVGIWFQQDIEDGSRKEFLKSLKTTADLNSMQITFKGFFEMNQKPGTEEIDLKFSPAFRI